MTTLQTFCLPDVVIGSPADVELGRRTIAAWQRDGILEIATDEAQSRKTEHAFAAVQFDAPSARPSCLG